MIDRWVVKIFALIGTFILPLLSTLLPYRLSACIEHRGQSGKRILSYLMCFGGGIFFGTYLLHMGPEVRMLLDKFLMKPYNIDYPISDLITGIGFFVVLFAEKIVLRCNKKRLEHKRQSLCLNETEDVREWTPSSVQACANPNDACQPCIMGLPCVGQDGKVIHTIGPDGVLRLLPVAEEKDIDISMVKLREHRTSHSLNGSGDYFSDEKTKRKDLKTAENKNFLPSKTSEIEINVKKFHSHNNSMHNKGPELHRRERKISEVASLGRSSPDGHVHTSTRSIVLILALSLHRIFEGMSVGLQKSTQDVLNLFLAVMCHETVIGFSLGLQFVKSRFPLRRLVITSLICSVIMPFGVAIGTIMTEVGQQSRELEISNGVLQAFAMGTFIYVTFFEILQEEIDPEDTSIAKICFIAIGFSMMALLTLIPEDQSNDDNHLTNLTIFTHKFSNVSD